MKRLLAVSVVYICFVTFASAADSQLIGLMMPDAKVLAGVNITQLLASPLGQRLLTQGPMSEPGFQEFVQTTGFDPTRNIAQIVAASQGVPGQQTGLVAIRGTFDVARLVAMLKMKGVTVDDSSGVPTAASPDGKGAFAFLSDTLAIIGDAASVTGAIARRSTPSMLDPVLLAKADSLSGTNDAWVVSTVAMPAGPQGGGDMPGGINMVALQKIQQASAGVKFGTSLTVTAEAVEDTPQNANSLAELVRMGVSLVSMNQASPQNAQIANVLKDLAISTQGTSLKLSLSIPMDVLDMLAPSGKPHPLAQR